MSCCHHLPSRHFHEQLVPNTVALIHDVLQIVKKMNVLVTLTCVVDLLRID
jgi:hypothetical protein